MSTNSCPDCLRIQNTLGNQLDLFGPLPLCTKHEDERDAVTLKRRAIKKEKE